MHPQKEVITRLRFNPSDFATLVNSSPNLQIFNSPWLWQGPKALLASFRLDFQTKDPHILVCVHGGLVWFFVALGRDRCDLISSDRVSSQLFGGFLLGNAWNYTKVRRYIDFLEQKTPDFFSHKLQTVHGFRDFSGFLVCKLDGGRCFYRLNVLNNVDGVL